MGFFEEVQQILSQMPNLAPEVKEYRLHYDDFGNIYMCTMQQHPTDTKYLVVDQEVYDRYFDYVVVDNQLKKIDRLPKDSVKLKSSSQGYCVVKDHAGLILESGDEWKDTEYYEQVS